MEGDDGQTSCLRIDQRTIDDLDTARNEANPTTALNNESPSRLAMRGGPMVAALSRNFGGRSHDNRSGSEIDGRNRSNTSNPIDNRSCPPRAAVLSQNLQANLRDRMARQRHPQRILEGAVGEDLQRKRGQELVPEHVIVSPQAFLKFFSL